MFEQRSRHAYKSESQVSGKLWGLECRLVGSVFLLQGVRVQAQQKFHHPAIPRAGWGGGGGHWKAVRQCILHFVLLWQNARHKQLEGEGLCFVLPMA